MLVQRILTVSILLPIFLAALFGLSREGWGAAMLFVVLLASIEWARLAPLRGAKRVVFVLFVIGGCVAAARANSPTLGAILLAIGVVYWLGVAPLCLSGSLAPTPVFLAVAGWIVLVCAWYALYVLQVNPARLLALLSVVWIADTAAYFVGRRYGKKKLAPLISPGKTREGVIGAAVAVGVYYSLLWIALAPGFLGDERRIDLALVVGIALLSVEGDLFESWMKRRAGVKDSGALLPGHGGVLDRIDGIVAVLPLAALAAVVLNG